MAAAGLRQKCRRAVYSSYWPYQSYSSPLRSRGTAAAAEPKAINVGWTGGSGWTSLPDRVAMERGFFEKEGLKPRYIQFQGTNLMLNALLTGEPDFVTIIPFIAGAATRGSPVKVVSATTKSGGYSIIPQPDTASVKNLRLYSSA